MTNSKTHGMEQPLIVDLAAVAPQPWRNGGGVTHELLAWPSAADWQLRLSVADIERDGPFSSFPGVQRWFCVLQGEGVLLEFNGQNKRLRLGDAPLGFDGAAAPGCLLLAGPTRDLNLMLRGLQAGEQGGLVPVRSPPWPACAMPAAVRPGTWAPTICCGGARPAQAWCCDLNPPKPLWRCRVGGCMR
jgi:hypothetical protein